jgi:predicted nucleic acid-binding protein
MTLSPSRLADSTSPLVLDASSGLNLLATGQAAAVLQALRRELVITVQAAKEVTRDPLTGAPAQAALERLAKDRLLCSVRLSPKAYECFLGLVSVPSSDALDDGEAATLAHAAEVGGIPVLDERKATRLALPLCAEAPVCTLDILSHQSVIDMLGITSVTDAIYSALFHARMRIPETFRPWVIQLVGTDRLRGCSSVPQRWLATK